MHQNRHIVTKECDMTPLDLVELLSMEIWQTIGISDQPHFRDHLHWKDMVVLTVVL